MKGQSINLTWVIGTTVFLTALVFSITYTFNSFNARESQVALQEELSNIDENFRDLTEVTVRQAPLNVRGPSTGFLIPVRKNYIYSDQTETAVINTPYQLNKSEHIFRTIVDAGNNSYHLTEFEKEIDQENFENDIETGNWLNNSKIAVNPGDEGLEAISIDSTNLLRNYTTFDSSNFTIVEHTVYGETLDGDLELYNGSSELLIDSPSTNHYLLKNFTKLYWSNGSTTQTLEGNGDFESGKTEGLVVQGLNGNDYGVVWTGIDSAEVSKPDNKTVNVSITDSGVYRVKAYQDTLSKGKDRINFSKNGTVAIGAKNEFQTVSISEMNKIRAWQDFKVERELEISNIGYNFTYGQFIGGTETWQPEKKDEWNDGDLTDNYTSERIENSLKVDWKELQVEISGKESDTTAKVDFRHIDESGSTKKTETFEIENGLNSFQLSNPDTEQAELKFYEDSPTADINWKLENFNVTYKDKKKGRVEKGELIPFSNVEISQETFAAIEDDGDIENLKSRIAVWR